MISFKFVSKKLLKVIYSTYWNLQTFCSGAVLLSCLTGVLCVCVQDIFKQATEDRLTSAYELPYFEGDFWPNVLEESIKELEQEEEERKKEENTASSETTEVS